MRDSEPITKIKMVDVGQEYKVKKKKSFNKEGFFLNRV